MRQLWKGVDHAGGARDGDLVHLVPLKRKVDVRLPGKGNSNSHGARPVHLIITMIKWIRTSRLSIPCCRPARARGRWACPASSGTRASGTWASRTSASRTCHTHVCVKTDMQTDRQTNRETDRQTDTHTYTRTHTHTGIWNMGSSNFGISNLPYKREFKLPWREAGPPDHLDDKVDSDQ